jgi:hypothetical protein
VVTHIDSATIALFTVAYDANGNTLTDVPSGLDFWMCLPKGSYLKVVVPPLVPGTTACVSRFSKSQE